MSQRRYKGSEIQQWKFEKLSSAGYYRIINVYTGQVLGIEGNSSADLARIETQPWSSSNMYQNWYIYSLGSGKYEIVNRYTGKTFTNSGANNGTDGTRIVQWPRRGTIWYEFGSDGELSKLGGLPHRTITLQREGDLTSNATWLPIITTACNSWTTSAGANIGTTATGSSFFIIEVDSYSWAAYGRCIKWPQENVASTSGRIEINARTINATTNARRSTVAHEIGHLLWLSDNPAVSNDNNSLMAGGRNRETVFTPQPYDIQNVLFRYN